MIEYSLDDLLSSQTATKICNSIKLTFPRKDVIRARVTFPYASSGSNALYAYFVVLILDDFWLEGFDYKNICKRIFEGVKYVVSHADYEHVKLIFEESKKVLKVSIKCKQNLCVDRFRDFINTFADKVCFSDSGDCMELFFYKGVCGG